MAEIAVTERHTKQAEEEIRAEIRGCYDYTDEEWVVVVNDDLETRLLVTGRAKLLATQEMNAKLCNALRFALPCIRNSDRGDRGQVYALAESLLEPQVSNPPATATLNRRS